MSNENIYDGITGIREDIVQKVENYQFKKKENKKSGKKAWMKSPFYRAYPRELAVGASQRCIFPVCRSQAGGKNAQASRTLPRQLRQCLGLAGAR